MKKAVLFVIILFVCCSCYHCEKQEQHGVIVDVEHVIHHSECWHAHIHYNDTICVYETFYNEVHKGDSVSRIVNVRL